jgi:hypothetical protein
MKDMTSAPATKQDILDLHQALKRDLQAATQRDFAGFRTELQQDMTGLRRGVSQDMADLRIELKEDMADLRNELKQDMTDLRTELKQDMSDLRTELKQDTSDLRVEMKQDMTRIGVRLGNLESTVHELTDEMRLGFKSVRVEIQAAADDVLDQIEATTTLVDDRFKGLEIEVASQKQATQNLAREFRRPVVTPKSKQQI